MIKTLLSTKLLFLPLLLVLTQPGLGQPLLSFQSKDLHSQTASSELTPEETFWLEAEATSPAPIEPIEAEPAALAPEVGIIYAQPSSEDLSPVIQPAINSAITVKSAPVVDSPRFQFPTIEEKKERILSGIRQITPVNPYQNWENIRLRHKILILLITVFFVLTVAMLIAVLASRFYKLAVQANAERLRKRYELLLMHVLFFDEDKPASDWDQDKIVQHFKRHYLKSAFKRKILISEILDLNKNFTGQFAENLRLLFIYLKLEKDSFALLQNPQWNLKAQGICELAQMLVYEAAPYIKALINHPNDLVRMESHIALVKLEMQRGLSFLHQLHRTFTKWQQLNLQNALSKLDREDIPDFSEFLSSPNLEVVEFSTKMIGIYNQVDALPAIENLLKHPVESIRLTAIETLRLLDAAQAVPALLDRFATDTKDNQVAILSAVASLGGAPNEFFAEQLFSGDHALQLEAAKALHSMQELESFQVLEPQIQSDQLQQIIRHALDCRN
jgi:hypothetical protein